MFFGFSGHQAVIVYWARCTGVNIHLQIQWTGTHLKLTVWCVLIQAQGIPIFLPGVVASQGVAGWSLGSVYSLLWTLNIGIHQSRWGVSTNEGSFYNYFKLQLPKLERCEKRIVTNVGGEKKKHLNNQFRNSSPWTNGGAFTGKCDGYRRSEIMIWAAVYIDSLFTSGSQICVIAIMVRELIY